MGGVHGRGPRTVPSRPMGTEAAAGVAPGTRVVRPGCCARLPRPETATTVPHRRPATPLQPTGTAPNGRRSHHPGRSDRQDPARLRPESLMADTVGEILSPCSPANACWSASIPDCASNAPASGRICWRATEARLTRIATAAASTSPGPRTETALSRPSSARPIATGSKNTSTSPLPIRGCNGPATASATLPPSDWKSGKSLPVFLSVRHCSTKD